MGVPEEDSKDVAVYRVARYRAAVGYGKHYPINGVVVRGVPVHHDANGTYNRDSSVAVAVCSDARQPVVRGGREAHAVTAVAAGEAAYYSIVVGAAGDYSISAVIVRMEVYHGVVVACKPNASRVIARCYACQLVSVESIREEAVVHVAVCSAVSQSVVA